MRKAKLTKINSLSEKSELNYHTGYQVSGNVFDEPTIGKSFMVYADNPNSRGLSTSKVTEIIDEFTFKTLNSTYKIEYLDQK